MIKFLKEFYQRLFKAETPAFFKKIFYAAVFVAAPQLLEWTTIALQKPEMLPTWVQKEWLENLAYICVGAGLVAKLTVHWAKTDLEKIPDVKPTVDVFIENGNIQPVDNQ